MPGTVVVKVSGKHINPEKPNMVKGYAEVFRSLHREGYRLAVVVGGGPVARAYIAAAREAGVNRALQDVLGIEAARLNARLLAAALHPEAYPEPPRSIWEALEAAATGKIVIAGGFQPGQSTAGVAALLAEALNADLLVLATTVDGVYTADPRRSPEAKLIPRLDYETLRKVLQQSVEPGRYELLDPLALSIVERSKIPVRVVNGSDPDNVARVVRGSDVGSLIATTKQ
ncbi:UMP kinase [Pyrodictium delaneyi]|uniref:UMP kinase n=1 Tax=Pyrodictium delaneyi TaxID=1273541 RepID=UPI0015D6D17F|nr:UMP kinase [Pyrodictium delaneyi]